MRSLLLLVRDQWMGALALFLFLTGGTAFALSGSNTVFSDDITNGEVRTPDLATGAVTTAKLQDNGVYSAHVRNDTLAGGGIAAADLRPGSVRSSEVGGNSLSGADINEGSLGQVPSAATAAFAGTGRHAGQGACDPEGGEAVCGLVSFSLERPTRVLVTGSAFVNHTGGSGPFFELARCRAFFRDSTTHQSLPGLVRATRLTTIPVVAITPELAPGFYDVGIQCFDGPNPPNYVYADTQVSALTLAP